MPIDDLRLLPDGLMLDADLAIVGAGPAGLTVARELAGARLQVLVIESGGLEQSPEAESLNEIVSIGAPREMDQSLLRRRMLGGSSTAWAGRVTAFDSIDYQARAWVPHSGWPFTAEEMAPYLDRAAAHMGLGPNCYDDRLWELLAAPRPAADVDPRLLRPMFWQYSRHPGQNLGFMNFGAAFTSLQAANVRVILNASATHINVDQPGGRFSSLEISTLEGKKAQVRARALVLAAGGIDNARLLLASNRVIAAGLGNGHDMVGRFLMDHPRGPLGYFDPATARPVQDVYDHFKLAGNGGPIYVHGLTLSPELQEQERLLNCAAWVFEDRAEDDPWEAMKRLRAGDRSRMAADVAAAVSHPRLVLSGLYRRAVQGRGLPHKAVSVTLRGMAEQRPDPDSRILLSDRRDRLGIPLPLIDWKVSEDEKRSLARLGRAAASEFRRLGLPELKLVDWIRTGRLDEASLKDVGHPTGATRMSDTPRTGVVDRNCEVHGVGGLYVTGSSVFPTAGHANPTLMIVAMAIRLADRLKQHAFKPAAVTTQASSAASADASNRRRVLVTGGTGRIGRHLVRTLVERGYQVRVVSSHERASGEPGQPVEWHTMNWLESLDFEPAVSGCDAVVHLGAEASDTAKMQRVNVEATGALVEACERSGVKFLCYTSTVSVYGSPRSRVVTEETPVVPTDGDLRREYWAEDYMRAYARTKLLGEHEIGARTRNMECVIFRPTVVRDLDGLLEAGNWSTARKALLAARRTQHIYVGDVVHAIIWMMERALNRAAPKPGVEIYNLADDAQAGATYTAVMRKAYRATGDKRFTCPVTAPLVTDLAMHMLKYRTTEVRYPLGMLKVSADKLLGTGYRHAYGIAAAQERAIETIAR